MKLRSEPFPKVPLGRLGRLMKGYGGTRADAVETGVPCVRYGDLYTYHKEFVLAAKSYLAPETAKNYFPLRQGDVVFAASGETLEEIGKSAEVLLEGEVRCGGDTIVFRPSREFAPGFLGYALDSSTARSAKARMGRGFTVVHIYQSELRDLPVPTPPLAEQHRIAAFLDHETARIDELVREQERLQALLAEKRDEVIGRAVREGVDGHEAYEIDDVFIRSAPRSWQVSPLRRFLKHISPRPVGEAWRDYTLLSLTRQGIIKRDIDSGFGKFPAEFNGYQRVQPGQVVFCLFDMDETPRTVGYSDQRGMITSAYAVFEPTEYGDGEFISYYFQYVDTYKGLRPFYSGLRKTIRPNNFLGIRVAMPDRSEQRRIARFLKVELSRLDSLADTVQRGIDLLLERRAALVTAAVTGQLDLRDWTPPAPEAVVEVA